MTEPDRIDAWDLPLSRREVMLASTAGALAAGGEAADLAGATDRLPALAWQRDLGTQIDGSPGVLANARVALVATNALESEADLLFGLDLASGQELWDWELPGFPQLWHHRGTVYHQRSNSLVGIEPRTGEDRFRLSGRFGNPFFVDGRYACFSGRTEAATVVDLDAGQVAWRPGDHRLSEVVGVGQSLVVLRGDDRLVGLGVEEGERLWTGEEFQGGNDAVVTGRWPVGFLTSYEHDRTTMVDLRDGERVWTRERVLQPQYFEPDEGEGVLLAVEGGTVRRLSLETGREEWARELTDARVFLYEVAAGLAIPVAEDAVWALSLRNGGLRWRGRVTSPLPAVIEREGTVYASGEDVAAYSTGGTRTWDHDLTAGNATFPAIGGDYLVASSGTTVYGFDLDRVAEDPETTRTSTQTPTTMTTADTTTRTSTETPTTMTTGDTTIRTAAPTTGDEDGSDVPTPGFGIVAALLGLGGLAEYLRRKLEEEE